jgi:hypothetical protein
MDESCNGTQKQLCEWKLPKGTLLRIFPTIGNVDNRESIDGTYTIEWENDEQYWYEIVYDFSKDQDSTSKEIVMIDAMTAQIR